MASSESTDSEEWLPHQRAAVDALKTELTHVIACNPRSLYIFLYQHEWFTRDDVEMVKNLQHSNECALKIIELLVLKNGGWWALCTWLREHRYDIYKRLQSSARQRNGTTTDPESAHHRLNENGDTTNPLLPAAQSQDRISTGCKTTRRDQTSGRVPLICLKYKWWILGFIIVLVATPSVVLIILATTGRLPQAPGKEVLVVHSSASPSNYIATEAPVHRSSCVIQKFSIPFNQNLSEGYQITSTILKYGTDNAETVILYRDSVSGQLRLAAGNWQNSEHNFHDLCQNKPTQEQNCHFIVDCEDHILFCGKLDTTPSTDNKLIPIEMCNGPITATCDDRILYYIASTRSVTIRTCVSSDYDNPENFEKDCQDVLHIDGQFPKFLAAGSDGNLLLASEDVINIFKNEKHVAQFFVRAKNEDEKIRGVLADGLSTNVYVLTPKVIYVVDYGTYSTLDVKPRWLNDLPMCSMNSNHQQKVMLSTARKPKKGCRRLISLVSMVLWKQF